MKLLVVCQYFYPEQFRVNDICFELVKLGYDVTVLTGLPNYPYGVIPKDYRWFKRRYEDINGVRVIRSCLIGRGQGQIRLALNYDGLQTEKKTVRFAFNEIVQQSLDVCSIASETHAHGKTHFAVGTCLFKQMV